MNESVRREDQVGQGSQRGEALTLVPRAKPQEVLFACCAVARTLYNLRHNPTRIGSSRAQQRPVNLDPGR